MFKRALVRLTLQYSVLLLLLFSLFSGCIYVYMDHTFGADYDEPTNSLVAAPNKESIKAADIADEGLDRLRNALIASYFALLIFLPIVSYLLARRSLRPIQKGFEDQQKFVDNASHELRTPLSIVQGELELALSKKRSTAEYQQAMQTSLEEVYRLTDLIAQLLLLARGTQDEIKQSTMSLKFNAILQDCIDATDTHYSTKRLKFTANLDSCKVGAIDDLLSQAVGNVLDNAAKFSSDEGVIRVTLKRVDDRAVLTIVDEGIGMSDEQLTHAFQRFWRADNARTVKGFGLGLSLVKQILELHQGTINLESAQGKGTTVIISLPASVSR